MKPLLFVILSVFFAGQTALAQSGFGKISGRIVIASNQAPVPVATVILFVDGEPRYSVRSNPNGNFSFSNLAEGNYQIQITKTGLEKFTKMIRVNPNFTLRITIPMNQEGENRPVVASRPATASVQSATSVASTSPKPIMQSTVPSVAAKPAKTEPSTFSLPSTSELPAGVTVSEPVAEVIETQTATNDDADVLVEIPSYVEFPDKVPAPEGGMGEIIKNIDYPELARRNGIEGKVIVSVTVNADGDAVNVEILKGAHPLLNEAAIFTIYRSKFVPATHEGNPVASRLTLPIKFGLR